MKPVKGFSSYFVSKDGIVTSKDGKELSQCVDNLGYLQVTLRKDGKSYTKRVHRIVGETYLKPVKGKHIVNHKDGNKRNCKLSNLEYMSNAENTKHGYDNDLYRSRSRLPVIVSDLDGNKVNEYLSIRSLSKDMNLNRKTVSSILNDDRTNNYNYTFKYKELERRLDDMDKLASYRELIEKEAGVIGGALGGIIGGTGLGVGLGSTAANVRNKLTLDPERKDIVKNHKQVKKELATAGYKYEKFSEKVRDGYNSEFNNYMASLSPKERSEVSIGQIEDILKTKANSMNKQASVKSTGYAALATGVPMAILATSSAYKDGTDKDTLKNRTNHNRNTTKHYNDVVSEKKKHDYKPSVANATNLDTKGYLSRDNAAEFASGLDNALKKKGLDRSKVKYKEYKKMYNDAVAFTPYDNYNYTDGYSYAINNYLKKIAAEQVMMEKCAALKEGLIPGDYSRAKQIEIDPSEYRTISSRDMRLYEKASENAKNGAKRAKQVASKIKGIPKWQKVLLATGVAGAGIAGASVAREGKALLQNPEKRKDTRADKSRDKDTKDKLWRDSISPSMKRERNIAATRNAVNLAMMVPSAKLMGKGGRLGSQVGHKLSGGDSTATSLGRLAGQYGGAYVGSLPARLHEATLINHQEVRELDRLKKRYLGEGITDKEKKELAKANRDTYFKPIKNDAVSKPYSVEERVQEMRRAKNKQEKKASEQLDELYKEASTKWSKDDKKGYAKNVAINVAQDFMNAGNPLNIGSSVVGSLADAAILEKSSLKLNKQLKADQISKRKVDDFNKTIGLKNGTTAINTATSLGQKK